MDKYAVVLAAGKGTRMKSRDPQHSKVSYPILGKALVNYVLDAIIPLEMKNIVVVVGFGGDVTKSLVEDRADVVWQKDLSGTGNAVLQAKNLLRDKEGSTLVICGDTPLVTTESIENIFKVHEKINNKLTIVTAVLENPKGYGRIIREEKSNHVLAIKEEKDCNEYEKDIHEVNAGLYVFDNKSLFEYIDQLTTNNAQKEYYLTDLVEIFIRNGKKVGAYVVEDAVEVFGINDRIQLSYAGKVIRKRINHKLMLSGVSMEDPDSTYISPDVQIGRDTIIMPNTTIFGKCRIGEANTIGPNTYLNHVTVGDDNLIQSSWISDTEIGNFNEIGPFTKMRAGTIIGNHCRVGNFVELKNANFKDGVKSAHLTYIGDSEVGEKTNIGCGTITANYDGYNKTRCDIGKNVFLGSGTILVAPIKVEDASFTAAGSTITKDVKTDSLVIARARQVEIEHGYTTFMNKAKAKKEASKK
ncbi:MAG: bifunctional UDP-N-acetylglucosamine diphosphorylase/glucosamine-1-phosphate N-acetyltransferase GlmU [Erysipelotrichaceae bacterium]|nr:bifunctional UDP-N-acetylglucosamine diphosphorylase/glucosamine-1-phosphate N-acetyltransferase GlmU [Erysipelotrichaceae bacterium]